MLTSHLFPPQLAPTAPASTAAAAAPPRRIQVDLNLRLICQNCRDPVPNIVEDFAAGDLICGSCGLVLGNRIIDTRSEWRTFANGDDGGDDPSRVGSAGDPIFGRPNQLDATTIDRRDGGTGSARDLSRAHGKVTNLRGEQQMLQAFREIQSMCEGIGLSKIAVDSAKQFYKRVEDEKLLRGKTQEAIMASCIYIACREHKVNRTFREICALTKVSKKEIGRCYKAMHPLFDRPSEIDHSPMIIRFSSFLGMGPEAVKNTHLIVDRANERGVLAGKSPISLVAAALYFTSSLSASPKTAKEIAEIAGCTEATLKNAYKVLYEDRNQLIIPEFKSTKPVAELPTP
ncbi:cyclin-like protein [Polychytrium aggregatum]|uniref:cyclin-like protein n=1 Tax=Polychytrium aggregatum TaxID=110093 RepID=UPI0022FE5B46|nr:cyclin-like protein [Polychytrium aggregatum]KAI9193683.1 cyclin-like protein [Polychytrium aggregatum]